MGRVRGRCEVKVEGANRLSFTFFEECSTSVPSSGRARLRWIHLLQGIIITEVMVSNSSGQEDTPDRAFLDVVECPASRPRSTMMLESAQSTPAPDKRRHSLAHGQKSSHELNADLRSHLFPDVSPEEAHDCTRIGEDESRPRLQDFDILPARPRLFRQASLALAVANSVPNKLARVQHLLNEYLGTSSPHPRSQSTQHLHRMAHDSKHISSPKITPAYTSRHVRVLLPNRTFNGVSSDP